MWVGPTHIPPTPLVVYLDLMGNVSIMVKIWAGRVTRQWECDDSVALYPFVSCATERRALCNCGGRSLPLFSARRKIPLQAFALK